MKLIYIAGPYTAKTAWGIECNIHRAREVGALVAKFGAMPVIPHANTAHFDDIQPAQFFIEGTLELMKRCDGVVVLPNSDSSKGTQGEIALAKRLGIPVYEIGDQPVSTELEDLENWVRFIAGKQLSTGASA